MPYPKFKAAFLTSTPGGTCLENGERKPCPLNGANDFLANLSAVWKSPSRCLLICAEPDNFTTNDEMRTQYEAAFPMSGLPISGIEICDSRNESEVSQLLSAVDVVILSGGHTLTQNRFFKRLGLKEQIMDFSGVLIGVSGGSMNCADVVYAQPEWEEDFSDPTYERFPHGLGLTDIMILPHYQELKNQRLHGLRLIEDVAFPDSMGKTIYALPDGSYILIQNGRSVIYGEMHAIRNGKIF